METPEISCFKSGAKQPVVVLRLLFTFTNQAPHPPKMSYIDLKVAKMIWKSVLVTQSCPALCNPMDCTPLGSSVHGILQARVLKWVVISFSRGFPDPELKSGSPALQSDSLSPYELSGKPNTNLSLYQNDSTVFKRQWNTDTEKSKLCYVQNSIQIYKTCKPAEKETHM